MFLIIAVFKQAGIDLSKPLTSMCYLGNAATVLALGAHLCGKTDVAVYYVSSSFILNHSNQYQVRSGSTFNNHLDHYSLNEPVLLMKSTVSLGRWICFVTGRMDRVCPARQRRSGGVRTGFESTKSTAFVGNIKTWRQQFQELELSCVLHGDICSSVCI